MWHVLEIMNALEGAGATTNAKLVSKQLPPMLAAQASSMTRQSLPLLLTCLSSEDNEVSQCTLAFLHSYVGRLRKLLLERLFGPLLARHEAASATEALAVFRGKCEHIVDVALRTERRRRKSLCGRQKSIITDVSPEASLEWQEVPLRRTRSRIDELDAHEQLAAVAAYLVSEEGGRALRDALSEHIHGLVASNYVGLEERMEGKLDD